MKDRYIIILLILITSTLFLTGLHWGLPSDRLNELYFTKTNHIQKIYNEIKQLKPPRFIYNPIRSYHPDEYFIIKTLQSINFPLFKFSIEQFSIGGAYLYLYGLLLFLLGLIGFVDITREITYYFFHPKEIAMFYIIGRVLCVFYAIGIAILTYIIAWKICKNKLAAFISSIFLIFSPLFLLNSHYMYVDILGLFWIMLTLYFALRHLNGERINPFFIGMISGMAAGNKITFLLTFFIPFLTFLIEREKTIKKIKNIGYSFISFIIVIIITYPYFWSVFYHLLSGEGKHATQISFSPFYITSLKYGIGIPLMIFLFLGFIFTFIRKPVKSEIVIISWTIFFFFIMSAFSLKYARYILPVLPTFIITGVNGWFSFRNRFFLSIRNVLFILIILFTFIYGMAFETLFINENNRTEAGIWIKKNIPEKSSIGVTEIPWQFQMPPFDYYRYKVEIVGYDIKNLKKWQPDYFILSSFQAPIPPYPLSLQKERVAFYRKFIDLGLYFEEKKFEKYAAFGGIRFKIKQLPEDLIYLNPSIVIFKKFSHNSP